MPAGAADLPQAEGAPDRTASHRETPNLTISEAPKASDPDGIPPAELERAMTRDDALGNLIGMAFKDVPTASVDAVIAEMLGSGIEKATAEGAN